MKKGLLHVFISNPPLTLSMLSRKNYPNLGDREIKSLVTHGFG